MWVSADRMVLPRVRRLPVPPTRLDESVGRDEKARRRPVSDEVRRLRTSALVLMVAAGFMTFGCLYAVFLMTNGPLDMAALWGIVSWVRVQRVAWDGSLLLAVPVTVLVPSVFVVLFASAGPTSPEGEARREATLEVLTDVLWSGLVLGIALAYLAAIPEPGHVDLGGTLLSAGIAIGSALIASTLRVGGTRRDLLVAQATKRRKDLSERAELLGRGLEQCPWARWMSRAGLRHQVVVTAVGVAAVGSPLGVFVVWGMLMRGSDEAVSWGGLVGAVLAMWVFTGGQGLYLMYAWSRHRLALPGSNRLGVLGLAAVPGSIVMVTAAAALSESSGKTRNGALLLVGLLLASDLLALLLNRTLLASVLDYRRLRSLADDTSSQLEFLGAKARANFDAAIHHDPAHGGSQEPRKEEGSVKGEPSILGSTPPWLVMLVVAAAAGWPRRQAR